MSKRCPECGRIENPLEWGESVETCDECIAKIRGISTDYWEQLTMAENQNDKIRKLTYKRLEDDAKKRGVQYMAELAYVYRQKCNNIEDHEIKIEYCDEYLSFMNAIKENVSTNEYMYIEDYTGVII